MKIERENIIIWVLRIIVSGFFILSAFSKLLPANSAIFLFEKQIVDLGITNWFYAPLLARAIVAFELFLGMAILQNHFLKNIIVPATFVLLLVFCIHLTYTIFTKGNSGSCGCFGQLIPMTPLQAIIKNVLTMAVLVYVFLKVKPTGKKLLRYPFAIFIAAYLGVFIFFQPKWSDASPSVNQTIVADTLSVIDNSLVEIKEATSANIKDTKIDTTKVKNRTNDAVKPERKKMNSIFTKYTKFNTGNINLNSGKKIVCLFSLECEHCQASNKILQGLKKKHKDFPGVYILAMGEEKDVDNFFSEGGGKFPYTLIPPEEFFPLLDKADFPPRIVIMDNGNFLGEFINFEKLDTNEVMKAVRK